LGFLLNVGVLANIIFPPADYAENAEFAAAHHIKCSGMQAGTPALIMIHLCRRPRLQRHRPSVFSVHPTVQSIMSLPCLLYFIHETKTIQIR